MFAIDPPNPQRAAVTRLAPSPTGVLHLGNARTFLINWALARQSGWRILLRMEDLNVPKPDPKTNRQILDILQWLGMDWDDGPTYQTHDLMPYQQALDVLNQKKLLYRCFCSRKDIEQAVSAPHVEDHETRYPGTCRNHPATDCEMTVSREYVFSHRPYAIRVHIPDEVTRFDDAYAGAGSINVQQQVGDFVVVAKTGLPSYQLAVIVDDLRQSITHVVRGNDLYDSTARQKLLADYLEQSDAFPQYLHVPLIRGEDGRRLAKRHGDTRLTMYRDIGVSTERILGLLAYWCDVTPKRELVNAKDFLQGFDLQRVPREDIVFCAADDDWLKG